MVSVRLRTFISQIRSRLSELPWSKGNCRLEGLALNDLFESIFLQVAEKPATRKVKLK
jgi:hypothetical protein